MSTEPLRSEFAEDPDMQELLREYAAGLAETCRQVQAGLQAGNVGHLRILGHQLKGSGGGYGYPALTDAGAELERATQSGQVDEALRAAAERLVQVCRQVQAGMQS